MKHKIHAIQSNDDETMSVTCECGEAFNNMVGSQALAAHDYHRKSKMRTPLDAVDPIMLAATIASDQHDRGELDDEALIDILETCINAASEANGYAELYGVPFPERKERQS